MTVQELYEYAKQRGLLDYEVRVQYRDDGGWYYGTGEVESVIVEDDKKVLIL